MSDDTLSSFIESVCGDSHLRVETDFGGGYVRLKSSEAEKRQAAQDIRSTEDIIIELLRNSRDAHARHIFVALQRDESARSVVILDDGDGIPPEMQTRIFEPRVTSKLDTAHMDKWGMHGRGMALYSVSANATEARVLMSAEGRGTAILVKTNLESLGEKADQSTFPKFEVKEGVHVMRGPRNMLRTIAEFALEHRNECSVYCGSFVDVAATLYEYGLATTSPALRAFGSQGNNLPLIQQLAFAPDPETLADKAATLGLAMSTRSARRIIDGAILGLPSMLERLSEESFPQHGKGKGHSKRPLRGQGRDARGLKVDQADVDELKRSVADAFRPLASRYFLEGDISPEVRVSSDAIRITIPIEKLS